ncbi:MAG: ATP-binding protein [Pedobacter sp.]
MRWYFTNCMGLCRIDETNEQERSVGKGAGIALSICYDMIQQMNGRLWVETEPTKGTTFYNSLPQ